MVKSLSFGVVVLSSLFILHTPALAADPLQMQDRDHVNQQISNSHILTQQERNEYQSRVRNATSQQERDRIQNEYQKLIRTRTEQQWRTKDQKVKKQPRLPRRQPDDFDSGRGFGRGTGGGRGR